MITTAVHRWMNELAGQGIFMTDAELRICGWNHWLELHSGQSAAAMLGRNLFDAYPQLRARNLHRYYEEALCGQARLLSQRLHRYLLPMPAPVNEPAFAQMQQSARIAPLVSDRDGDTIIGTITVIDDVTERIAREEQLIRLYDRERAARQEAEAANRTKDEFLATVSHELRTPLNAIAGWIQILRQHRVEPEDLAQGLETIERNVKAQSQIIEDILDVSRIITGKLSLDVKPVDMAQIVEAALDAVRFAAAAKEIRLDVQLDRQTSLVSGDPNRLQQIIWNLMSNALKFTPSGGAVTVRLQQHDSQVEVIVSDTGKGIAQDFLPYVFDRFRQADSTSTRQHAGLGLGLALVRHLAEVHGGTVTAASRGDGRGATFTVRLPVISAARLPEPPFLTAAVTAGLISDDTPVATASQLPEPQRAAAELPAISGARVLIVDDDIDAREMLEVLLSHFGAEIRTAPSAQAGLQVLTEWLPDVLVSDIGMPDEDGYALIEQVRRLGQERGGRVPAIALTGFTRAEDRQRLLAAGYQVPLAKPVEVEKLVAAIAALTAAKNPASRLD